MSILVQTIAVIAAVPYGVVQLGSRQIVSALQSFDVFKDSYVVGYCMMNYIRLKV